MAFGDEEPINQVNFEEEVDQPSKKLDNDPPSLEMLELPPGEVTAIDDEGDANQRAEELREEIRRLEQRLKELDSKK